MIEEPGTDRVEMEVTTDGPEIRFVFDQPGTEDDEVPCGRGGSVVVAASYDPMWPSLRSNR
jgi:hypothetical protein